MLHSQCPGLPTVYTVLVRGMAHDVVIDTDEGYLTGQHLQRKLYGRGGYRSPRSTTPSGHRPGQCIEASEAP